MSSENSISLMKYELKIRSKVFCTRRSGKGKKQKANSSTAASVPNARLLECLKSFTFDDIGMEGLEENSSTRRFINPLSRFVKANQSYCMMAYDQNRTFADGQRSRNQMYQHYTCNQQRFGEGERRETIFQNIWRFVFRSQLRRGLTSTQSHTENAPDPQLQFRKAHEAEDCMSLVARTHSEQVEIYLNMKERFMEGLCGIFPHPVMRIQGTIETGPVRYETWSPYYSTSIDKYFYLEDILLSTQYKEAPSDLPQLLNSSTPSRMLEPLGTRTLKLVLKVSIEWSDNIQVPIQIRTDSAITSLYENNATKDFTIVVGNGAEIKCHSVVLAGRSAPLTAMLSSDYKTVESKTLKAEMKDVSEEGATHLLRYLYGMQMATFTLGCDIALELMQVAHKYELTQLEEAMRELFLRKGLGWFTPDILLEVYYYVINLDGLDKLVNHCLRILHSMTAQEIQTCERYQELSPDVRENLMWKLFEVK